MAVLHAPLGPDGVGPEPQQRGQSDQQKRTRQARSAEEAAAIGVRVGPVNVSTHTGSALNTPPARANSRHQAFCNTL